MDPSLSPNSWLASAELGKKVFLDPALIPVDSQPICAAIGVFDGVHRGHQRVLEQSRAEARVLHGKTLAITFDKHPKEVLCPEHAPPMIQSLERRLAVLAACPVDDILLLQFDQNLSRQTPEDFVGTLAGRLRNLRSLSVGSNFTFGHQRRGNLELLARLGSEWGFQAHGVDPVMWQDKPVSSTRIRQSIREGDLVSAAHMMGRPYVLEGVVVQGDQLGRKLGFPTANLNIGHLVCPPNGVYAVEVLHRGQTFPGVLNIGHRPTIQAGLRLQVEVHLLDFQGDLYGASLQLIFEARLRPERKFTSVEQLKTQILQDISQARQVLQKRGG